MYELVEQKIRSSLVEQFLEILSIEADSITRTSKQLQTHQVEQALTLLSQCQGKIVILGVGKSGIVARKITATLNSLGIFANYLHPYEALHGDLGIVTRKDVAVLLSNSGETEEIIRIIPSLKHRQVALIAIVGNIHSSLARKSDVVLDASVDREACPLNLAPTASTTTALAIGDALAMTLIKMRGITPEDFALNHPGGLLGKRLTIKVEDLIYPGSEQATISFKASWIEVVSAITKAGAGAVNIINETGILIGLITDGDIRRCMEITKPIDLENLRARTFMTTNPVTATPDTLAYEALKIMEERSSQISVLPVVDSQHQCLGLIRLHDIVRSGLS